MDKDTRNSIERATQRARKLLEEQGDVINWLVSDSFGLSQGRSIEAERAIEAAEAWMRGDTAVLPSALASQQAIHDELARVLPGHDAFWPRWIVSAEKSGARP